MKSLIAAIITCVACLGVSASDNAMWLAKAKACAEEGSLLESDQSEADGFYCLVLVEISMSDKQTKDEREGAARLEAQRKISAYINGESMSAERKVASKTVDGQRTKSFSKVIETKSEAFMRGLKVVGTVDADEKSYMVCVATERSEDQSAALAKAQAKTGDVNTVNAVGEGATPEEALDKAKQSAIEQVLGSVVVARSRVDTKKGGYRGQAASGTDGVVESFRYVNGTGAVKTESGWRVEIIAKVSKDNPFNKIVFLVEAPQANTVRRISEMFSRKGVRVTNNPEEASYVVRCTEDYEAIEHPINQKKGTRINFGVRVENMRTGEEYMNLVNEKPVTSFVGNEQRQKQICSQKAFAAVETNLCDSIEDLIARIMRRTTK